MNLSDLDIPAVLSTLFYPRPALPGRSFVSDARDGVIPVAEGVVLGYRLYPHTPDAPVILYFHGNGEIVSDHDFWASQYHQAGASLLVVDYRGYGWSTGRPTVSALLADVEPVVAALPALLAEVGLSADTLLVMGRSLGSAPAIHAAYLFPKRFKSVIIESGFARAVNLLNRLGLPQVLTDGLDDPVGNDRKLGDVTLPLLVIHGEQDSLLPVEHGEQLYAASAAVHKELVKIAGAGHNDLMFVDSQAYFGAVARFVRMAAGSHDSSS